MNPCLQMKLGYENGASASVARLRQRLLERSVDKDIIVLMDQ